MDPGRYRDHMSPCAHVRIPESLRQRSLVPDSPRHGDDAVGLVPNRAADYPAKYRGSLLAGAIGDALGRPVEGEPPSAIRARHGVVRDFRRWRGWKGGPIGTITDDTQLTMVVADSLIQKGCFDPADLANRLVEWLPHGRGKGRATTGAVLRLTSGTPWHEAGTPSAGNGAAMRVAPLGLFHPLDLANLRIDAALSAVVTHADPMAVVSAVAQAFSVAYLLHISPGSLDIPAYFAGLRKTIGDLHDPGARERRPEAGPERVRLADRLAEVQAMLDMPPKEAFHRLYNGAFVLESLPAALWCFLSAPDDPEQVLVTAVNAGYDADTVAAMAGNLVGAYLGDSALPERWLTELEFADELRTIAARLYDLSDLSFL